MLIDDYKGLDLSKNNLSSKYSTSVGLVVIILEYYLLFTTYIIMVLNRNTAETKNNVARVMGKICTKLTIKAPKLK